MATTSVFEPEEDYCELNAADKAKDLLRREIGWCKEIAIVTSAWTFYFLICLLVGTFCGYMFRYWYYFLIFGWQIPVILFSTALGVVFKPFLTLLKK